MERIENFRKQYYESVRLLQDEQDILNALPQPEYENFFPLIRGVIKKLENELKENQEELASELDPKMKEYIQDEIDIIQFKINVCINLLQKGLEDEKIEEEALSTPKKNIIFATTESGNICIENDMKTIPEEYYDSVESCFISLMDGIKENNEQKAKGFTTVNKKIAGIHEIKPFKVRLLYKNLSPDTVYVLMLKMKKSDNDRYDRTAIETRYSNQIKQQYERLKKEVKDPMKKEELIQEHKKTLDRLLGNIKHNKR